MEVFATCTDATNVELVTVPQSAVVPVSRQLEIPRTPKIPRPPNAFMLFANEYRKKLAIQFPRESNKEISVRLGGMWKTMLKSQKEEYFKMAKEVDRQHKEKYPNYVYNPKEARMRKAAREQSRENRMQVARGAARGVAHQGGAWASPRASRQPPTMANQYKFDSQIEEVRKNVRNQVEMGLISGFSESYVDCESFGPYSHLQSIQNDFSTFGDISNQYWYSCPQDIPHSGNNYLLRSSEDKMQHTTPWNMYPSNSRAHQASPFMMRHQMMGGNSQYQLNQTNSTVGSLGINRLCNVQPYHGLYQQSSERNDVMKEDCARIGTPMPSTNQLPKSQPVLPQTKQQTNSKRQVNDCLSNGTTSSTSTATTNCTITTTTAPIDMKPLPTFEQAFGSTEIGRFSHGSYFLQQQQQQQQQQQLLQQQQQQQQLLQQQNTDLKSGRVNQSSPLLVPDDFQTSIPPFVFSPPPDKMEASDILLSPSSWPSLLYYHNTELSSSPSSSCFAPPSYFDFPQLLSTEPEDSSFILGPGFSDSTVFDPIRTSSPSTKKIKLEQEVKVLPTLENENTSKCKGEELGRQDVVISGLKLRECTVISQNERICVLKESDASVTENKEISSL